MFQKGDSVVYGNLGVCKINDLITRQFEGWTKHTLTMC